MILTPECVEGGQPTIVRDPAHPRDYHAELEDEEEEAAPTSEKRLKREIRAEALRRLEEAARTESDFLTVVDEWNKLDRNRERRERDHENLRGDVPLEFQAVPDPKIAPLWMNLPRFRQLCQGNFLDIIFSCPYELHQLTANRFLSKLFFTLSDEQKEVLYYLFVKQYSTSFCSSLRVKKSLEVLYYLFVKQYSTTRLAAIRGQSDRNIRKLRMTIQKKLQRRKGRKRRCRKRKAAGHVTDSRCRNGNPAGRQCPAAAEKGNRTGV